MFKFLDKQCLRKGWLIHGVRSGAKNIELWVICSFWCDMLTLLRYYAPCSHSCRVCGPITLMRGTVLPSWSGLWPYHSDARRRVPILVRSLVQLLWCGIQNFISRPILVCIFKLLTKLCAWQQERSRDNILFGYVS